jgi:hypothetical protein
MTLNKAGSCGDSGVWSQVDFFFIIFLFLLIFMVFTGSFFQIEKNSLIQKTAEQSMVLVLN